MDITSLISEASIGEAIIVIPKELGLKAICRFAYFALMRYNVRSFLHNDAGSVISTVSLLSKIHCLMLQTVYGLPDITKRALYLH